MEQRVFSGSERRGEGQKRAERRGKNMIGAKWSGFERRGANKSGEATVGELG